MGGFNALLLARLLGNPETIVVHRFDVGSEVSPSICMFPRDADTGPNKGMIERLVSRFPCLLQSPTIKTGAELRHELRLLMKQSPVRGEPSNIYFTGKHSYIDGSAALFASGRGPHEVSVLAWSKTQKSMLILSYGEGAHLFIGSFCSIAQDQKVFLGGNHYMECASTFPFAATPFNYAQDPGNVTNGHVVIENDVWIGRGCTIMSGVTIGSGSVVAANSVVTKNVAPYTVVGGNPAKPIRKRFTDNIIERLLLISWWDRTDEEINTIVPLLKRPLDHDTVAAIEKVLQK